MVLKVPSPLFINIRTEPDLPYVLTSNLSPTNKSKNPSLFTSPTATAPVLKKLEKFRADGLYTYLPDSLKYNLSLRVLDNFENAFPPEAT